MPNANGKVCKLRKALYGLKQCQRVWFEQFRCAMLQLGYKQTQVDHMWFVKCNGAKVTTLIVYMDDIVVTRNNVDEINNLKHSLAQEFEIKDLGSL